MSIEDINLYRQKMGQAPLTKEDMIDIVRILREDRVGASIANQKASKKKKTEQIETATETDLDELFE